jgi:hypothetical protein
MIQIIVMVVIMKVCRIGARDYIQIIQLGIEKLAQIWLIVLALCLR